VLADGLGDVLSGAKVGTALVGSSRVFDPGLATVVRLDVLTGPGFAHLGHAAAVCWDSCSIVARASTAALSDAGASFGASSPMAWRALVMNVATAVMEVVSESC
jgi:hypothetical protein